MSKEPENKSPTPKDCYIFRLSESVELLQAHGGATAVTRTYTKTLQTHAV